MAATNSWARQKIPRRILFWVSSRNQPFPKLNQEEPVAVVVENHVPIEPGWSLPLKMPKELQKVLMSVPRHAVNGDGLLQNVADGKKRGGAVSFVIACQGFAAAPFHCWVRLGAT